MTDLHKAATMAERNPALPNESQGLYRKFEVTRTDGSSAAGGKHHGCEYFVLDVDHDPRAKAALSAYADAVQATHPHLADDMRRRYGLALREALAAPVVPPGYALVPLEPTPEMRSAGFMVDKGPTIHHACADIYRAMLAAAPKPKEKTS